MLGRDDVDKFKALSDEALLCLCYDEFRSIYARLTEKLSRNQLLEWINTGQFPISAPPTKSEVSEPPSPYTFTYPLRVFLCHASEDKVAIKDLYHRLKSDGLTPWMDEIDILPGQMWRYEISKAVRSSDIILVCLSNYSISKAGYVQKEIKDALDVADEQPEGMIFIIPLKLEECQMPDRLSHLQWVSLFDESGYDRLMQALQVQDGARKVEREIPSPLQETSTSSLQKPPKEEMGSFRSLELTDSQLLPKDFGSKTVLSSSEKTQDELRQSKKKQTSISNSILSLSDSPEMFKRASQVSTTTETKPAKNNPSSPSKNLPHPVTSNAPKGNRKTYTPTKDRIKAPASRDKLTLSEQDRMPLFTPFSDNAVLSKAQWQTEKKIIFTIISVWLLVGAVIGAIISNSDKEILFPGVVVGTICGIIAGGVSRVKMNVLGGSLTGCIYGISALVYTWNIDIGVGSYVGIGLTPWIWEKIFIIFFSLVIGVYTGMLPKPDPQDIDDISTAATYGCGGIGIGIIFGVPILLSFSLVTFFFVETFPTSNKGVIIDYLTYILVWFLIFGFAGAIFGIIAKRFGARISGAIFGAAYGGIIGAIIEEVIGGIFNQTDTIGAQITIGAITVLIIGETSQYLLKSRYSGVYRLQEMNSIFIEDV